MDTKSASIDISHTPELSSDGHDIHNADELRLSQMGHKQELKRHLGILSVLGFASTTTLSWLVVGYVLALGILAGGPGAFIYGFILVAFFQCFLAASLAEFVSAYPTAGGMYHWVAAITPAKSTCFLSFITGWSTVVGWIFINASNTLTITQVFLTIIGIFQPEVKLQSWMTFLAFEVFNILTSLIVMFGNRVIPGLNATALFYLQIAWFVTMVVVLVKAPSHQTPKFVFKTWINFVGWESRGICFITTLVNSLYGLGGLDGVAHITEDMRNPSRNAPLAIAFALALAFITGLSYLISMLFSVQNWIALGLDPSLGLPLAQLYYQGTATLGGAFALTFIVWTVVWPMLVNSQLSSSRIVWAFSRDGGLPFANVFSKVHPTFKVPVNAQIFVTGAVAILGCVNLGSSVAFNAIVASSVVIMNFVYIIPIIANIYLGRKTMHQGSFKMGRVAGLVVNTIAVIWLAFGIVFFSFPLYMPATVSNMNYSALSLVAFLIFGTALWFVTGKKFTEKIARAKE